MNRTSKSKDTHSTNEITVERPSKHITTQDIENNKKDEQQLGNDLKLLATLLGRPVSQKDIPNLVGKTTDNPSRGPQSTSASNKLHTTTAGNSLTTANPALVREVELLTKIVKKPDEEASATTAVGGEAVDDDKFLAIEPAEAYGKTNDALLATLLKQRGIGPAHNNIPLNIYSSTTTQRPVYPSRSARPILDGLSWLWRTWQETAPGVGGYQPQPSRTRTRNTQNNDHNGQSHENIQDPNGPVNFDDGLDSDTSSVSFTAVFFFNGEFNENTLFC